MKLKRYSPTRVRPGASPELLTSRNLEGLESVVAQYAEAIEANANSLAKTEKGLRGITPDILAYRQSYRYAVLFGVKADGVTDDHAAWVRAINGTPEGATLIIPLGQSILRSTLHLTKRINLLGFGTGSTLSFEVGVDPDTGVLRDGMVVGTLASPINSTFWRDFAILSDGNVRDQVVLNHAYRLDVRNVHVLGAARYEVYGRAVLSCPNLNFICSHNLNATYEYPAYTSGAENYHGLVCFGPALDGIPQNNNNCNMILEGGANGTGRRVKLKFTGTFSDWDVGDTATDSGTGATGTVQYVDTTLKEVIVLSSGDYTVGGSVSNGTSSSTLAYQFERAQYSQEPHGVSAGGNNYITGTYQGAHSSWYTVQVVGADSGSLDHCHLEDEGKARIAECRQWSIGSGYYSDGDLEITDSILTSVASGATVANLIINSGSSRTELGNVYYNGGKLQDSSTSTIQVGAGLDADTVGSAVIPGPAGMEAENLVWNYDMRRWRIAADFPDGYSIVGSPGTDKTGTGLADTNTKIVPYACKVTSGGSGDGLRWTLATAGGAGHPDLRGYWVSASAWIYRTSGGTNLTFRCTRDSGTSTAHSVEEATTGAWVRTQLNFYVDPSWTTLEIEVICNAVGAIFYTTAWSIQVGNQVPRQVSPNSQNVRDVFYANGMKVSVGGSAPHASHAIPGDIWIQGNSLAGPHFKFCTAEGNPGTYAGDLYMDSYLDSFSGNGSTTPSVGNKDGLRIGSVASDGTNFPEASGRLLHYTHQTDSYRGSFQLFKGQSTGKLWYRSADAAGSNAWLSWRSLGQYLEASATWDPANMAADGDVVSTTIAVTGAVVGDQVSASHSAIGANNVLVSAHVQASGTVRVVLMNKTGAALDIASGTLTVKVWK